MGHCKECNQNLTSAMLPEINSLPFTPQVIAGIAALAVIMIVAVVLLLKQKLPAYQSRKSLVTPTERNFLNALDKVANGQFRVFSKVRMEDIIVAPKGLPRKRHSAMRGRVKSRHIDFVLCDPKTLEFRVCVELDDRSHERKETRKRDAFVNKAFAGAGIPLLRIPARRYYDLSELRSAIKSALASRGSDFADSP